MDTLVLTENMLVALGNGVQRRLLPILQSLDFSPVMKSGCSVPISIEKLSTGEPYAGEPHVRFGGRGSVKTFPTPIGQGVDL